MIPLLLLAVGAFQVPPTVTSSLRPEIVRVGSSVVLTIRVESEGAAPDLIELDAGPDFDVLQTQDRYVNAGVGRSIWVRDYTLTPWKVGRSDLTLTIVRGGQSESQVIPGPLVQDGGGWRVAERRPRPEDEERGRLRGGDRRGDVVPQGTPPPVSRDLQRGTPGFPREGQPSAQGRIPGQGWIPGQGRVPGGWAATADQDPWWAELVPELFHYDGVVDDQSGFIRLETGVTPDQVYVGQQITLFATVTVLPEAVSRMGRTPRFIPPEPTSFRRVREVFGATDFPSASTGRLANSYSFQQAYFPRESGEWTFPTGRLLYGFSGRSASEELSGELSRITVLPVPVDQAPGGFQGAVGRFKVNTQLLTPRVAWGDMGVLRVEISGVGDVTALQPPVFQVWGGELTPLFDRSWVEVRQGVVGGVRVFEYGLIPLEAIEVVVDPLVLTYFDPYLQTFGVVAGQELRMGVVPPEH